MDKDLRRKILDIINQDVEVINEKNVLIEPQIPKGLKVLNLKCSVLCVDIRESSKLAEKLGQKNMTKVYHIFSKITAKAVNEIGGRIIQFAGDGFLAAFTDSAENNASKRAYACIEKIQKDLKETYQQSVDKSFHFSCGYGMAYGHIYMTRVKQKSYKLQSFGIFPGHATNMSSKLCDIAEPNQLIIDINSFQQIKPEKYKTNILYGEEVFLCQV